METKSCFDTLQVVIWVQKRIVLILKLDVSVSECDTEHTLSRNDLTGNGGILVNQLKNGAKSDLF